MRHQLLSFVAAIAIVAAVPAMAAEIETSSQVDAVTVYPDGATVTRMIRVDLPAGDSTLFALGLSAHARSVIVACRRRGRCPPRHRRRRFAPAVARAAANVPQIDRRIEALRDATVALDGEIAAATARRKFAERFRRNVADGYGRERRGPSAQRMARRVRGRRRRDRHRGQRDPCRQDQTARHRPRDRACWRPSAIPRRPKSSRSAST